ncbi:MAG TPA: hypothetical protein VFS41_07460, partial [Edaphobacter sp.]|nr:hypothetical protein [Edaphobacter sp.]
LWVTALIPSFQLGASVRNKAFPRFVQYQGTLDRDGFPTSGVKLCTKSEQPVCYQMPPHQYPDSSTVFYQFGLSPQSERLPIEGGGSWIFFTGTFSDGGSGTLERLAVLRFEGSAASGKVVNLLPYVAVTNVSNRAIWKVPEISPYPILVCADYIWNKGETHFGVHHFTVDAWVFDEKLDHYVKLLSYQTKRKYDGGDEGAIRVLKSERKEILARLAAARSKSAR